MPDTYAGAFTLIGINLSMVFLVLWLLALVINLTHRLVQGSGAKEELKAQVEAAMPAPVADVSLEDTSFADGEISPAKKAAIVAALAEYMRSSPRAMFLRNLSDSGAWGKTSRDYAKRNASAGKSSGSGWRR